MKLWRRVLDGSVIVFSALLLALSYHIFILCNQFAPAGLPGIGTILQYLFGFKVGYFTLLVNIPLVLAVFLVVGREYAIRSAIFAGVFSLALLLLDNVNLDRFVYNEGFSTILAPVAGGVVSGFCYSLVMRRNGSTGGTDLLAALVHHRCPEQNFLWMLFGINAFVAALSYVVYDFKLEPVILCLIYCFVSSKVTDVTLRGFKEAVKFEIVTDQPEELAQALMKELHRGVTEIPAEGGFTHNNKTLLICVVGKRQIVKFEKILENFPGTFAYLSSVKETVGNFRK